MSSPWTVSSRARTTAQGSARRVTAPSRNTTAGVSAAEPPLQCFTFICQALLASGKWSEEATFRTTSVAADLLVKPQMPTCAVPILDCASYVQATLWLTHPSKRPAFNNVKYELLLNDDDHRDVLEGNDLAGTLQPVGFGAPDGKFSYTLAGLQPGAGYSLRVRAIGYGGAGPSKEDAAGKESSPGKKGPWSTELKFTTAADSLPEQPTQPELQLHQPCTIKIKRPAHEAKLVRMQLAITKQATSDDAEAEVVLEGIPRAIWTPKKSDDGSFEYPGAASAKLMLGNYSVLSRLDPACDYSVKVRAMSDLCRVPQPGWGEWSTELEIPAADPAAVAGGATLSGEQDDFAATPDPEEKAAPFSSPAECATLLRDAAKAALGSHYRKPYKVSVDDDEIKELARFALYPLYVSCMYLIDVILGQGCRRLYRCVRRRRLCRRRPAKPWACQRCSQSVAR